MCRTTYPLKPTVESLPAFFNIASPPGCSSTYFETSYTYWQVWEVVDKSCADRFGARWLTHFVVHYKPTVICFVMLCNHVFGKHLYEKTGIRTNTLQMWQQLNRDLTLIFFFFFLSFFLLSESSALSTLAAWGSEYRVSLLVISTTRLNKNIITFYFERIYLSKIHKRTKSGKENS